MGIVNKLNQKGFTIVEVALACVIFPLLVVGLSNAYDSVRRSYTIARQYNEIYAVLSACPEIDRALDFDALTGTTNCYPNNTFQAEGGGGGTITYTPTVSVTPTSSLTITDPLSVFPDSKVVDVMVSAPQSAAPPLEVRMLVTRNGIGQL